MYRFSGGVYGVWAVSVLLSTRRIYFASNKLDTLNQFKILRRRSPKLADSSPKHSRGSRQVSVICYRLCPENSVSNDFLSAAKTLWGVMPFDQSSSPLSIRSLSFISCSEAFN